MQVVPSQQTTAGLLLLRQLVSPTARQEGEGAGAGGGGGVVQALVTSAQVEDQQRLLKIPHLDSHLSVQACPPHVIAHSILPLYEAQHKVLERLRCLHLLFIIKIQSQSYEVIFS